ncbi:MAG: tetratricopeptide repeat protein [bacterium]|nr:tetratricopeptide repeat protein [bacterium]MDZ4284956.1 tetratricopeptide repeat protein [Patescibacteria group bacterium]
MQRWHIILILILVGTALYAPTMNNPLFWDDDDWIVNNPAVHELSWSHAKFLFSHDVLAGVGARSNYYRPVLMLSFAINWALGGRTPWGYHLVSNGLHIANAVLIFLLLDALLKNRRQAALAALLWLVHPLQTEAIAYIAGRGDPLSVFFMLSAILLWLRTDRFRYWALPCAVLATLSRETAVLLPGYMVVVLLASLYRAEPLSRAFGKALKATWPFVAIAATYTLLRLTILDFQNTLNWYQYANVYTEHITVRTWTFLQALWTYLRLTIVPLDLHMERTIPVLTTPWYWSVAGGSALLLSLAALIWRDSLRGRRLWFFGAAMFLLPLVPSSGIIAPINALIYEHWLYLSLLGFAAIVAVYGIRLYDWLYVRRRALAYLVCALGVAYVGFFNVQTVRRTILWGSPEQFYLQIISYVPDNARVLNNLANIYAARGDEKATEYYLRRAMEADPSQPAPYHNLGNLIRDRGRDQEAAGLYRQAISVDPLFHYAYRNLAALLLSHGDTAGALKIVAALRERIPQDTGVQTLYEQVRQYMPQKK